MTPATMLLIRLLMMLCMGTTIVLIGIGIYLIYQSAGSTDIRQEVAGLQSAIPYLIAGGSLHIITNLLNLIRRR